MSTTGFTALPAGWYNYYSETDERGRRKVYRNPCPGILKIETVTSDDYGNELYTSHELKSAEFSGATLTAADGANYLGTFYGEEHWEEFGDKAPNEPTLSA